MTNLATLRELLAKAAPSAPLPWRAESDRVRDADGIMAAECLEKRDAALIAALVNAAPALLDRLEAAEAALATNTARAESYYKSMLAAQLALRNAMDVAEAAQRLVAMPFMVTCGGGPVLCVPCGTATPHGEEPKHAAECPLQATEAALARLAATGGG